MEYANDVGKINNYSLLAKCPAPFHDFRDVPKLSTSACVHCGAQVSRSAASLYFKGLRTGLLMCSDLIRDRAHEVKQARVDALRESER